MASQFYRHPVLCAALRPGCTPAKGTTPRGLTWVYPATSGFVPRTSEVGAAPLASVGGPHLKQVYVIDQGLSALYAIEVASGIQVPGDAGPLLWIRAQAPTDRGPAPRHHPGRSG